MTFFIDDIVSCVDSSNSNMCFFDYVQKNYLDSKNCIIGGNAPDRTIIENNVRHFGRMVHAQRNRSGGWDATEEPSPVICDGALIGANTIIIGGIEIGKDSVIAANEVVKENVPEKSIFSHGKIKPLK